MMDDGNSTEGGLRYSQFYLSADRGPLEDSARLRFRVAAAMQALDLDDLPRFVRQELGQGISVDGFGTPLWEMVTAELPLASFLDLVTIVVRAHQQEAFRAWSDGSERKERRLHRDQHEWVKLTKRFFDEESSAFFVNDHGAVRRRIDVEFQRNRTATIAALGDPRFENVADMFDRGHVSLSTSPPDGKAAIRHVFAAAEGLFNLLSGETSLSADNLANFLRPRIERTLAEDIPARTASSCALRSFQSWVAACHLYRHEPGQESLAQPPLAIAVLLVSQGAAFIRWLQEFDGVAG